MAITITPDIAEEIRRHARSAYPEECCGLIGGGGNGADKVALQTVPLQNRGEGSRRNRYLAPPDALRDADATLRSAGLELIGIYHSHPDAPARPSGYDLEHATWPWLSYVIVSVPGGNPTELTSWTLADDRSRFEPELVGDAAPPEVLPSAPADHQESIRSRRGPEKASAPSVKEKTA